MSGCEQCAWEALGIEGVESKVIFDDPETGRRTVLTRMAPGAVIPKHYHTHVDETVYVLDGDFVEEEKSYGVGAYFVGKAETTHGPHKTVSGCTVLTQWNGGTFDFIQV